MKTIKASEYLKVLAANIETYGDGDLVVFEHGYAKLVDDTGVRMASGNVQHYVDCVTDRTGEIITVDNVDSVVKTVGVLGKAWSWLTGKGKK